MKNEFAGINFIDTYHRSGLYKRDLPFIGGQEGGGKIAAVTPKVLKASYTSSLSPPPFSPSLAPPLPLTPPFACMRPYETSV